MESWQAIFSKLDTRVENGTLSLPLNILITDGDDGLLAEVECKRDASGKMKMEFTPLWPDLLIEAITYPVTVTVTDHTGNVIETVISGEFEDRVS